MKKMVNKVEEDYCESITSNQEFWEVFTKVRGKEDK